MLKKVWKLFLGLVVCTGSACVTPTHASSAPSVIITHVQAASPTSAKDEMVAIYNNSSERVDITDWCLTNKANVAFVCFTSPDAPLTYYLLPYAYAVVTSESFLKYKSVNRADVSLVYTVTNQSSGSLVGSSDKLTLVDANDVTIDTYTWSSAFPSGKIAVRSKSVAENTYETSANLVTWQFDVLLLVPEDGVHTEEMLEILEPEEPETPGTTEPLLHPTITELLPNPAGSDTGSEFIEIFNPNPTTSINLTLYKLRVGKNLERSYSFPANSAVAPLEYKAFTNKEIKFSLLNSTSAVQLEYNGERIGSPVIYGDPPEGHSYAELQGEWMYTEKPTPGAANEIIVSQDLEDDSLASLALSTLKPCAAHQYRNATTNRCRNIVTSAASSTPKPCATNQYRSPETNRCRNISSNSSALSPCKTGQERNPETNRCRNIVSMSNASHSSKDVETDDSVSGTRWYWLLGIGGIVGLILTYAVWEWREELQKVWSLLKTRVARLQK